MKFKQRPELTDKFPAIDGIAKEKKPSIIDALFNPLGSSIKVYFLLPEMLKSSPLIISLI